MPDNDQLKPLLLLSDEPIRSRGDDLLEQDRYAALIAESALGTTAALIAIAPQWLTQPEIVP